MSAPPPRVRPKRQPHPALQPWPGQWHPFYEPNREALTAWLDGTGLQHDVIHLYRPRPMRITDYRPDAPPLDTIDKWERDVITLTRKRFYGIAPYVGDPFVYVWTVGVDHLKRYVCSEAAIRYTQDYPRPGKRY